MLRSTHKFMSPILFALIASPFLLSTDAMADRGGFTGNQQTRNGGYSGPGPNLMTIEEATRLPDDSFVTLRGKIIRKDGHEIYTFEDSSGQIKVEIDDDVWRGQQVGPNDIVELLAEVDKDWGRVEFDIEQLRKVQ